MAELLWWHRTGQKVTPAETGTWVTRHWRWFFCFTRPCSAVPIEGCIYTISGVGRTPTGEIGLALAEMPRGKWYAARHFRPVRETSIDCFRTLLSPTPDQVRELEEERV